MENNNFNVFNQYLDAQKNMMNMWNRMAGQFSPQMGTMPFNNPMEYYKTLMDAVNNAYTSYTGSPTQILERVTQGSEAYYNLYKLWEDIYEKNIEPTEENIRKVMDEWKTRYGEFYTQYMLPYLPQEVQNAIKQTIGLGETYQNSAEDFWGPWTNSLKELNDAFMKGAYKDPEGFIEYFNQWKDNYNESFSKLLNIPAMGLTREQTQRQLQTFDKYIKLIAYLTEVTIKINNLVNKTSETVITESFEAIQKGEQPKSFEEFYNFWKTNLSDAFDGLFYSEEFSKLLGTLIEAIMDLKIDLEAVMEKYLDFLSIPKKSDMNSLYKTVYELKKEVRALKKQINLLESEKEAKVEKK